MAAFRRRVEEAEARLEAAKVEAAAIEARAAALLLEARDAYGKALVPYREACRRAGVRPEFQGGRRANVAARVAFDVEKIDSGVRVVVKGRPGTEEVIPVDELERSINKAAYAYVERHLGPRAEVGNKGGSLSNRLRRALKTGPAEATAPENSQFPSIS